MGSLVACKMVWNPQQIEEFADLPQPEHMDWVLELQKLSVERS